MSAADPQDATPPAVSRYVPEAVIPTDIDPHPGIQRRKDPTVWMRSIRWHTYLHQPQPEGEIYLAHEEMIETIEFLKFAVREPGPPRAVRRPTP